MEQYIEMKNRCIHIIDEVSLKCKKCGSPWDLAKNNPLPFNVVKGEHRKAKEERYDMNKEENENNRNSRKP